MGVYFRRQRSWLLVIFILSGFAGLIYQSAWSHYLGLFLGHAAYAQALVLAIFMGGMAFGAAWVARAGQRWRNLVRCYAVIEAIIGAMALLFHTVFGAVTAWGYDWFMPALGAPWAVDMARWALASLLILPQTVLLGMTFPLMSGGLIRRFPGSDGALLGGLYFTNSIGAALGALVAVFVLLPWAGLPGAMTAAGVVNFVVAALAWYLAREPEPATAPVPATVRRGEGLANSTLLRAVLLGTALSGAASFAYEIIWIRMLAMAVGSTMHAFELMLASFVAGIALGGLWVRHRADRTPTPLRLVGWMQVFMGVAALASLAVYANAFAWVGWLMQALTKTDGGYALYNLGTASIAIVIMLPAAFFAGTTLPLFTVALLRAGHGERAIGQVYAWNTLGAIVGVFASIHWLIPVLGLKLGLCVAALVDMGIGLALLRWQAALSDSHQDVRSGMPGFVLASGIAAVALLLAIRIHYDPVMLASGVFRTGRVFSSEHERVAFYRDGKTASVSVMVSEVSPGSVSIATNGKPDAGIMMLEDGMPSPDELTMALLAALPLAFSDNPENVAVIGFGSGMTTHSLLQDARVHQVETIEIEQAMVDGARIFGHKVANAYRDPRSRIVIEDAKSYFAGQGRKFDIIVSEPSNPWISGVGALFSKEFYQFIPRHLTDDGLFVQWVQLYEIDDALIGSLLKAITPAFDDYVAWISNDSDLIIVARPKGKLPPLDFSRLAQAQSLLRDLERLHISTQMHMMRHQMADARVLRALAAAYEDLPPNSDYSLLLGLNAPRTRFKEQYSGMSRLPLEQTALLQALGIYEPLPLSLDVQYRSHFPADTNTAVARASAAFLRGGQPSQVHNMTASGIVLRALSDTACTLQSSEYAATLWAGQLFALFEGTTAFLPPDALQGVWINPAWQQCEALPDSHAQVLQLLQSHALRDWSRMEALGRAWLESRNPDSDPGDLHMHFDEIALSGIVLAQVHQQRWSEIEPTLEKFSPELSERYQRQFALAVALAKTSKTGGV